MYYNHPSESQSLTIKKYLQDTYKVTETPKSACASELTRSTRRQFHDLDYKHKETFELEEFNHIHLE